MPPGRRTAYAGRSRNPPADDQERVAAVRLRSRYAATFSRLPQVRASQYRLDRLRERSISTASQSGASQTLSRSTSPALTACASAIPPVNRQVVGQGGAGGEVVDVPVVAVMVGEAGPNGRLGDEPVDPLPE